MDEVKVHVVSFAIPYPADYGGVQDVFHKIRWLKKSGVEVHLHAWAYHGRKLSPELEELCANVSLYKRTIDWADILKGLPYTVASRNSKELLRGLIKDNEPILFETLHTTRWIEHPAFFGRKLLFRESNVEHDYYRHLAKLESGFIKKAYLLEDARRLEEWERVLRSATTFLNVSLEDQIYFRKHFPEPIHDWIPPFTPFDEVNVGAGGGEFVLFHGNLAVQENAVVAFRLLDLWNNHTHLPPLIVAGRNPSSSLLSKATARVSVVPNPSEAHLNDLISRAGWNLLFTPQPTGIKLKLLNVLFNGGRILANSKMVHGTALESVVTIVDDINSIPEYLNTIPPELNDLEWEFRVKSTINYRNDNKVGKLFSHLNRKAPF